jgi:hypothetical protein
VSDGNGLPLVESLIELEHGTYPQSEGTEAMLELRPNCELCDRDLPPDHADARLCSYECTFCAGCVETVLRNVCPNCGGGFQARPIRPRGSWRPETGLEHDPPGSRRRQPGYSPSEIKALVDQLHAVPPERR